MITEQISENYKIDISEIIGLLSFRIYDGLNSKYLNGIDRSTLYKFFIFFHLFSCKEKKNTLTNRNRKQTSSFFPPKNPFPVRKYTSSYRNVYNGFNFFRLWHTFPDILLNDDYLGQSQVFLVTVCSFP